MILSYIELLYLAAYLILVCEYVVMRHKVICTKSDAGIDASFWLSIAEAGIKDYVVRYYTIIVAQDLYWNRGTK